MKICVYCASSAQASPDYGKAAFELGRLLASNEISVVFGGGGIGSMGRLADGVNSVNGSIIGVMPRFMKELEWAHPEVENIIWTTDLAERKAKLIENSDAVIALPGGCGTFEELLEVITLKRLGIYLKPIIIFNQDGFYDSLIDLFNRSVKDKFMDERHLEMFTVIDKVDDVIDAVNFSKPWSVDAKHFATLK